MKRTAAILLALILALAAVGAFADTLAIQPGTPIGAPPDVFCSVFDIVSDASGFTFTWEEAPVSEDGYEVYTAHANDVDLDVKLYASDGYVSYAASQIKEYKITNSDEAFTIGQWIGGSFAAVAYTAYLADSGDVSGERAEELNDAASQIVEFLGECLDDNQKLKAGAVTTFTALDHPVACEVSGVATSQEGILTMRVVVAGLDAIFESGK